MPSVSAFVTIIILSEFQLTSGIAKTSYACGQEKANLTCHRNRKIAIRGVEYGTRAVWGRPCHYQDGDCRFRVNTDITPLNNLCSGSRTCDIITRLNISAKSDECNHSSLYRVIHYECISDEDIVEMCTENEKRGKMFYVSNQNFPHGFEKIDCLCLVTSEEQTKVTVNVIDLAFGEATPKIGIQCKQKLNISGFSGVPFLYDCSRNLDYYGYRSVFNGEPDTTIHLTSDTTTDGGRLFLQVKGEKPLTIKCQGNDETPTSVVSRDEVLSPTEPKGGDQSDINLPMIGAVIAGVGVLTAVVVLLVCLVIRRKRKLQREASERSMDIRDGVVDPFLVSPVDTRSVNDHRNGTASFRPPPPSEAPPAPPAPETLYAAPWDSHPLPSPSSSIYHNQVPSHYTYITPDILDNVTRNKEQNIRQDKPKPAVRVSKAVPTAPNSGNTDKQGMDHTPVTAEINSNIRDMDSILVDNSLYQPANS